MVTKVVTEHDVDNVTIIINPQNKLEAKIPTTSNEVVIEEVPNVTPVNAVVTLDGTERKIVKLGKVNGTEWLVFQLDSPKPTITKNIRLEFYDDVITGDSVQRFYEHAGKVRVTTEDGSEFNLPDASKYQAWQGEVILDYQGNNSGISGVPYINFVDKTYSVSASYSAPQTTSALQSAFGTDSIRIETNDVIYRYVITSVSVVQNTRTLPTFNISSRGNDNVFSIDGSKTVTNSDGAVIFEFDTNMSAYAEAGYKVYGVIKNNGVTIHEAPLRDIDQQTTLGHGDIQYSELSHDWMSGIIGKTLNHPYNLTAHVYLMNDAGDKIYPANQPDGYVTTLVMSAGLTNDF